MKNFVVFCVVATALLATAMAQGVPTKKCPPGEHSVLYCPRMAEPSCDNPTVHELGRPGACDIPDCFCNRGTLRDTRTDACVKRENCSSS